MSIPIHNVYYLLCYAWNALDEVQVVEVDTIRPRHVVDLLASVLARGVNHLLRRGLDRGYLEHREQLATVRGRIELEPTVRLGLHRQGRVHCAFDELSHDVLHNQILKTTITHLIGVVELDPEVRHQLAPLRRRLEGVTEIPLHPAPFGRVQIHRNNAFYRFLLHICELVWGCLVPAEGGGRTRFRDFLRDERRMEWLFERFILNFYDREQVEYSVRRDHLRWDAAALRPEREQDLCYLPQMETDVSLRSSDRTLIIDTKYYSETLTSKYHGAPKVHAENLYQLHAYLSNMEHLGGADAEAEGLLLYPDCQGAVDLAFELRGHRVRVKTLNLNQHWNGIHADLLSMLERS